jgi:hypothetical protein
MSNTRFAETSENLLCSISYGNRDGSLGITIGYALDGRSSISGRGKRFDSIPQRQDRLWGHPASYPTSTRGLSRWLKRSESEADNSPPSSPDVKNCGAVPPLPHRTSWRSA